MLLLMKSKNTPGRVELTRC